MLHALRLLPAAVGVSIVLLLAPGAAEAGVSGGTITSAGPLSLVQTTEDLGCAVNHSSDAHGEFFGDTACATLVAVGGTLYGPAAIPAGSDATPRETWTTVNQVSSGAGTDSNPYRIETTVSGGGLDVTQSDTYTVGVEYYGTKVSITNTTDAPLTLTLYRAGDCYLQDSDYGYGKVDQAANAVSCTTGFQPGDRIQQWAPLTAGSHYFEAGYADVWQQIGTQEPFPDTCACGSHIDNGAGLSWTVTLQPQDTRSFSHLTSFSPTGITNVRDSDGDGFPDIWEQPTGGVDTNGDGSPDLKLSDFGATPDKKDVFVQVGWTHTRTCGFVFFCSDKTHRPSLGALADVQRAFLGHGIRVHIDAGPESLMNPDSGALWGSRSAVSGAVDAPTPIAGYDAQKQAFDWTVSFDGYKQRLVPSSRRRIFHFAFYVGQHQAVHRSSSGEARPALPNVDLGAGSDFLISGDVQYFGDDGMDRLEEAGTFMHEFGHNLGLSHGGSLPDATVNYKPNYPSVMNYLWQSVGVPKYSALHLLDYSAGTLDPVDGANLDEAAGLSPDPVAGDIGAGWLCPDKHQHDTVPSVANVDWNCSSDASVKVFQGYRTAGQLRDHNDWQSLIFDGDGALGGSGDANAAATETPTQEQDPADAGISVTKHQAVDVTGPHQITMKSGSTAPLQFVVANHGATAATYSLGVVARGLTLVGVPNQVQLAPGESKTLAVTATAGPPDATAFFEVDVTNNADASDARSLIAEVAIVDQVVPDQPSVAVVAVAKACARPAASRRATLTLKRRSQIRARRVSVLGTRRFGSNPRRTYRVKLVKNCKVVATGSVRGRRLTLTVKPTGTRRVKRGGRTVTVKTYPLLNGRYTLLANGRGPKVPGYTLTFKKRVRVG